MNSNSNFTWNKDEIFTLSGGEFGLILNTLRAILNTEQAAQIILAYKAADVLEKLLAEGVEKGIVKEIVEPLKTNENEKNEN